MAPRARKRRLTRRSWRGFGSKSAPQRLRLQQRRRFGGRRVQNLADIATMARAGHLLLLLGLCLLRRPGSSFAAPRKAAKVTPVPKVERIEVPLRRSQPGDNFLLAQAACALELKGGTNSDSETKAAAEVLREPFCLCSIPRKTSTWRSSCCFGLKKNVAKMLLLGPFRRECHRVSIPCRRCFFGTASVGWADSAEVRPRVHF